MPQEPQEIFVLGCPTRSDGFTAIATAGAP